MTIDGTTTHVERRCPGCKTRLRLPAGRSGKVRCPVCQNSFSANTALQDKPLPPPVEVAVSQGSREWLELRRQLRMASETPAVLRVGKSYQTLSAVRAAKHGVERSKTAAMLQGTEQEKIARLHYSQRYGAVRPAFFFSGSYGCSLDGITLDRTRILEIKTPWNIVHPWTGRVDERWSLAANGKARPDDYAQIQHQLMVSRATIAHLWVWNAYAADGRLVVVQPDTAYWERICEEWDKFWPSIQSWQPRQRRRALSSCR